MSCKIQFKNQIAALVVLTLATPVFAQQGPDGSAIQEAIVPPQITSAAIALTASAPAGITSYVPAALPSSMTSNFTLVGKDAGAGNGGGAFICQDPSQDELLDLFEASIPTVVTGDGLTIPSSNLAVEDQIQNAFLRLNPGSPLYAKVLEVYGEIRSAKIHVIPDGVEIAWPKDANNELTKAGCSPKGIILFDDERDSMLQDAKNLAALPNQQQAALWVHETIYKFLRETQGDKDSIRARKIVGHLFSDESQKDLDRALYEIARLSPRAPEGLTGEMFYPGMSIVQPLKYEASFPGEMVNFYATGSIDPTNDPRCGPAPAPGEVVLSEGQVIPVVNSGPPFSAVEQQPLHWGKPTQLVMAAQVTGFGSNINYFDTDSTYTYRTVEIDNGWFCHKQELFFCRVVNSLMDSYGHSYSFPPDTDSLHFAINMEIWDPSSEK